MKKFLGILTLMLVALAPAEGVLVAEGPYLITQFEHHRDAYTWWRIAHEKHLIGEGMTLVHVDAHHDMDCVVGDYYQQWASTYMLSAREVQGVTNATFIDAAVNEGLADEIWWVIPDYLYYDKHFDDPAAFVAEGEPRQFYKYVRFCDCEKENGHVVCTLMDIHEVAPPLATLDRYTKTIVRVHFVTLKMLLPFEGEVLLDIDTDYFANAMDVERYPDSFYVHGEMAPWMSVEEFMEAVVRLHLRSRMVTIARSPPYTQEGYQYLSWELAERLNAYLSALYCHGSFSVT